MFYLLLSLASIAMAITALFQLIAFNPDRTDGKGNKITKKRLIIAIVFFTVCSIVIYSSGFNTAERKEAKYLNSIFEETYNSDKVLKETASKELTNDSIDDLIEELSESKASIEQLEPPETLPAAVKDSHDTLEDGLEIMIKGIRNNDAAELQRGQTVVTISQVLYEKYIVEHSNVKKLIDDEYVEAIDGNSN